MKLHLPCPLYSSLLSLFATAICLPAHAATVPDGYQPLTVHLADEVLAAAGTASGNKYAFLLAESLVFDNAPYLYGDMSFSCADEGNRVSMVFQNYDHAIFYKRENSGLCSAVFQGLGNVEICHNERLNTADDSIISYGCSFIDNTSVSFLDNSSCWGGAIMQDSGVSAVIFSRNKSIAFTGNTALVGGGAICQYIGQGSPFDIIGNGSVDFSNNSAMTGGAICCTLSDSDFIINGNGDVSFFGNQASLSGGALIIGASGEPSRNPDDFVGTGSSSFDDVTGNNWPVGPETASNREMAFIGNGKVLFIGNHVTHDGRDDSLSSSGSSGDFVGSGNWPITGNSGEYTDGLVTGGLRTGSGPIPGNSLTGLISASCAGGAVDNTATFNLTGNGYVEFRGNYISSTTAAPVAGGAIYSSGKLTIANNDTVIFRQNYEKPATGQYLLRSIYVQAQTGIPSLNLSAKEGGSIEFQDSVLVAAGEEDNIPEVAFNQLYIDGEGTEYAQTGDIIFNGAYTEQHLNAIKASYGDGLATDEEILLSQTTQVNTVTHLYDGRLIVKNGATYAGQGIEVHSSVSGLSTPTLLLQDAHINQGRYEVALAAGTSLELHGVNTMAARTLDLSSGSNLTFHVGSSHADTAALSLTGSLTMGAGVTITLAPGTSLAQGSYKLLSLGEGSSPVVGNWTEDNVSVHGLDGLAASFDNLTWEGNTLILTLPSAYYLPEKADPAYARLSGNQRRVYNALKRVGENATGELRQLANLLPENADALPAFLDSINGAALATAMNSQIDGNLAHLRRLRQNIGSGQPATSTGPEKLSAFINFHNDDHTLEADASGRGYRRTEWGAQFGMEHRLGKAATLGFALSGSRASISPTGDARYHEDASRLDLYTVATIAKGWQSITSLGAGFHRFDLRRRTLGGGMATADGVRGTSFNMMEEINYTLPWNGQGSLQPFFALQMSINNIESFDESGAGTASLQGDSRHAWATDLTWGARYLYTFAALKQAPAATLALQAGVVASVGDTTADLNLHFQGAPQTGFVTRAANRNRWGYTLGASLSLPVKEDIALYAAASAVLRGDSSEANAQIGIRLHFE